MGNYFFALAGMRRSLFKSLAYVNFRFLSWTR